MQIETCAALSERVRVLVFTTRWVCVSASAFVCPSVRLSSKCAAKDCAHVAVCYRIDHSEQPIDIRV